MYNFRDYIFCIKCVSTKLQWSDRLIHCIDCNNKIQINDNIPRFVDTNFHSNFGLQWKKFSQVQLDSVNGTDESERRFFSQSKLNPENLSDKLILEVGCGNGRFTEILLKYGANVIAVDGSVAIEANKKNHQTHIDRGNLFLLQADLFNMPVKTSSFDIVICYGVIQHTGNNKKAIQTLAKFPKQNGKLLLDIYSAGLKHFNLIIYIIRGFLYLTNKRNDKENLIMVENFVNWILPYQLKILKFLHRKSGIKKYLRYIVNRSPNSVYGVNLYLDGKITKEIAFDWSVMDTYDSWFPDFDHPVSEKRWKKYMITIADEYGYIIDDISLKNHGRCSVLIKK